MKAMMKFLLNKLVFVSTLIFLTTPVISSTGARADDSIGVNFRFNGDNIPWSRDLVALYLKFGITNMRIFEPNVAILEALRGSSITLSLGTRNEDIQNPASSQDASNEWVNTYVLPYANDVNFGWITIGNELIPGPYAIYVGQAMTNMYNAVRSIGLSNTMVTTVISMNALAVSFPPSAGFFSNEAISAMQNVAQYFATVGAGTPLTVNVYPYFSYAADPVHISLEYATFNAKDPVVDGNFKYFSLFDAMVDAINAAMEKINAGNVPLIVSETGWPTAGNDPYTIKDNAQMHNANLYGHVNNYGTPRRPDYMLFVFLFAMFNEDLKPGTLEQNFGLFYPNQQPVYPFFPNCLP